MSDNAVRALPSRSAFIAVQVPCSFMRASSLVWAKASTTRSQKSISTSLFPVMRVEVAPRARISRPQLHIKRA